MPFKSEEARRTYHKQWYEKNKLERRERVKATRDQLRLRVIELKTQCCLCPENNPCCLDFHHHEDNKSDGVARMVSHGRPWKVIKEEIDKCIVVCKNCHAKIHAKTLDPDVLNSG